MLPDSIKSLIESLTNKVSKQQKTIDKCKNVIEKYEKKLKKSENVIEKYEKKLKKSENVIEKYEKKLKKSENVIEKYEKKLKKSENVIEKYEKKLKKSENVIEKYEKKLKKSENVIEKYEKKLKKSENVIEKNLKISLKNVKINKFSFLRVNEPFNIIRNCGIEEFEKEKINNIWSNSFYSHINTLKANNSGNIGEIFVEKICKKCNIKIEYNGTKNKNAIDGTYDIKILNKRVEIKTARIGLSKSFQHENLRNKGCDYYAFLDILPNYSYLTILPKFNMLERNNIIGIKPHLRKGTSNVFKFTFSEKNINKAIGKKYSLKIDRITTMIQIENFLRKCIN